MATTSVGQQKLSYGEWATEVTSENVKTGETMRNCAHIYSSVLICIRLIRYSFFVSLVFQITGTYDVYERESQKN